MGQISEELVSKEEQTITVLRFADSYGISICDARRLTDEEKSHYSEWFRDYGFIGMGNRVELDEITWRDLPNRQPDGEFCGCSNRAWILTENEEKQYKKMNTERLDKKARIKAKKAGKDAAKEKERLDCAAQFDSWSVSNVERWGDDLSVEHTFILHGKKLRFLERNIFDFGTVINPTNIKDGAFLSHDDRGELVWITGDFWKGEGSSIALDTDELACVLAIKKFGKFVKLFRM